jgi:hypothetical protein
LFLSCSSHFFSAFSLQLPTSAKREEAEARLSVYLALFFLPRLILLVFRLVHDFLSSVVIFRSSFYSRT